jgi:hypothetical protein
MDIFIRPATKEDIPDIARIHVEGWQGAYQGLIDQDYIDSQNLEKRTADWTEWLQDETVTRLLAIQDDKFVGFIAFGPLRTAPPGTSKIRPAYSSEIYGLYLMPEYFRQGVGTALIKQAVEDLKYQKYQSTCLWVLKDNKRACAFYEKMGGQRIGKKIVEFGPTKAKEVCYGWRNISEILEK